MSLTPREVASIPLAFCARCGRRIPAVALAEHDGLCGWCVLTPPQAPVATPPTPPTPPPCRLVYDTPCGAPLQDRWEWPGVLAARIPEDAP